MYFFVELPSTSPWKMLDKSKWLLWPFSWWRSCPLELILSMCLFACVLPLLLPVCLVHCCSPGSTTMPGTLWTSCGWPHHHLITYSAGGCPTFSPHQGWLVTLFDTLGCLPGTALGHAPWYSPCPWVHWSLDPWRPCLSL